MADVKEKSAGYFNEKVFKLFPQTNAGNLPSHDASELRAKSGNLSPLLSSISHSDVDKEKANLLVVEGFDNSGAIVEPEKASRLNDWLLNEFREVLFDNTRPIDESNGGTIAAEKIDALNHIRRGHVAEKINMFSHLQNTGRNDTCSGIDELKEVQLEIISDLDSEISAMDGNFEGLSIIDEDDDEREQSHDDQTEANHVDKSGNTIYEARHVGLQGNAKVVHKLRMALKLSPDSKLSLVKILRKKLSLRSHRSRDDDSDDSDHISKHRLRALLMSLRLFPVNSQLKKMMLGMKGVVKRMEAISARKEDHASRSNTEGKYDLCQAKIMMGRRCKLPDFNN